MDTQYYLYLQETSTCIEPGASAKVTRGTNTNTCFERAEDYEDKYKKAVHNCETVLTQLISEKKSNRNMIVKQAKDNKYLINKVNRKCDKLQSTVINLKRELSTAKKRNRLLQSNKAFNSKLKGRLRNSFLNPSTTSVLLSGRTRAKYYEKEDIAAAALLKSVSNKCYKILKKRKLLCLPSEATISNWLQNFTVNIGMQESAIDVLTTKHAHVPKDIHCFLSFDEMQLKDKWTYDKVRFNATSRLLATRSS